MPKNLKKAYVRTGNPISTPAEKRIDEIINAALARRSEKQISAYVGDTVWCVFDDTPKGEVNPGTIIRVEIDTYGTVYTVLPDFSVNYYTFTEEDFRKTFFLDSEKEVIE